MALVNIRMDQLANSMIVYNKRASDAFILFENVATSNQN